MSQEQSLSLPPLNVLVVDDEPELRSSVATLLASMGHRVTQSGTGEKAIQTIRSRGIDQPESIHMVLLDVNLPGISGLEVLHQARVFDPSIMILIITAHGNIRDAVTAMREGAFNYIEKPVQENEIKELIFNARNAHQLVQEMGFSSPKLTLDNGEEFIGRSKEMRSLFQIIQKLGQVDTSVLIRGENGTGKELVARALHFNSSRKSKPFIALNCGAIPEGLFESELFGHEKGAFTGADQRRIGRFQAAQGGTLFLDEIAEMNPSIQVKLLRVLQEKKFIPVGSHREIKCDVRIIAATNRNLEVMIEQNTFRLDLFYRLNVIPVNLPPLRDHTDDIPLLIHYFLKNLNSKYRQGESQSPIFKVSSPVFNALMRYHWPGNIRELENIIERAFVLEDSDQITLDSLPQHLIETSKSDFIPSDDFDFQLEKENFERRFIIKALTKFGGKINTTAEKAGIPKNTLLRKIKKYEIEPKEYYETR